LYEVDLTQERTKNYESPKYAMKLTSFFLIL